jgi:integrase
MARPSKTAAVDFTAAHDLTHGLLDRAACPDGPAFVLIRDADKRGLRLRVTKAGGKHWQFETRIKGKLFTRALGEWPTMSIEYAKAEAHRLRGMTEQGIDPRGIERQQQAAKDQAVADHAIQQAHQAQKMAAQALTVGEVWQIYIEERRAFWGALHLADHIRLSAVGGVPRKRGGGLTVPGPLRSLMDVRLVDLNANKVTTWAKHEAKIRPTPTRLSWRLLRAFLTWCAEAIDPDTDLPLYADLLPVVNPAKTKKSREALGKPGSKKDALQREQLPAWFAAVQQTGNPAIAAYLQVMLLTGARPGELLSLRWGDVNMAWRGLTIHDKVDGERVIPLTRYVHHLLASLPKRSEWVFAGAGDKALTRPAKNLNTACNVAGVDHVSLHGLRRSFKSLTEWLDIPAGVVAQLMGHKPSATAEKHYTVRPLDLLRVHHERIETWILEQAGIAFDAKAAPGALRAVI